ncbi:MAG: hypothetical protein NZ828_05385 [Alphaproteobacteria bacterium]|nr:hypothetical protein [Alphaproteobacteria bacterium]|tara:strand:+ start:1608 stop:1769 length:162 start_codon:yes stop_codon:yes gene_type:complete
MKLDNFNMSVITMTAATAMFWVRRAYSTMLCACLNLMQNIHMIQKPRQSEAGL